MLRVLSLSHFEISEVPESIGDLKHLRYLNLSHTKITKLPESVGNLYNLQTLIVFGCRMLTKLPKSFLKLKELRHFDIRDTPLLKKFPLGIAKLENLQTLTKIIIGRDNGFAITDLKRLKNLCGEISIEGLDEVQSAMHAREANSSLERFTKLELKWDDGSRRGALEKESLNELKPYSEKLKELSIVSYGGTEFSSWVGDPSFHKLVNVSIRGCRKCTTLPPFGQLPSLKELFIQGMDEVKIIGSELTGTTTTVAFPTLEILRFEDMCNWEVWSTNNEVLDVAFPCLQKLQIKNCPNLIDISLQALPLLRFLEIQVCGGSVLRSLVTLSSLVNELIIDSLTGLTDEMWRDVVKYLAKVEVLSIRRCNEIRYLCESKNWTSKVLLNLKDLHIFECKNLESFGKKEDDYLESNILLSLKSLKISNCESIKHCYCPNSVVELRVLDCHSLTLVSFSTTIGGAQRLESLMIYGCKALIEEINNKGMPMLESLYIREWTNLKSITQFSNLNHLTFLHIEDCPSIEPFQLSNLTSLKKLRIMNCPSFRVSFHEGFWPPNLVFLFLGGLKNPISKCSTPYFPACLDTLGLRGEHVSHFHYMSHLLPSSLTLTDLYIQEFDELESLSTGLQHLTSLQYLTIDKCPKVNDLPKTLLPSLLSLRIYGDCPLKERCAGRGSHYWPFISHIPNIKIEDRSSYRLK
ncbi:putative leucine-rich repeat domain superfamily [Helianthus annuus]|nr:putative leucine-rich repeat domain superfamily [Helianthus annuus]KAJ0665685.1 putative leucine-rich repeat domain superfamily [Helianthus annuus]KAJ0851450.1 putative leucine-rich repeat domain superfamily [Helianthus annuus]